MFGCHGDGNFPCPVWELIGCCASCKMMESRGLNGCILPTRWNNYTNKIDLQSLCRARSGSWARPEWLSGRCFAI